MFAGDFYPFVVREREDQITATRSILGEEAFAAAWAEGRSMTMEQAIAYALENQK